MGTRMMSLLSSRNRVVAARYASSLPWSTSSYSYLCNKVLIHRSTVVHTWANVMLYINPGGWQLTCVIIPRSTYEAFRVLKCHKSSLSRIIDRTSIGISVFHLETNFVVSVVYIIHAEGLHLIQRQAKPARLEQ
jgi:hypothetical protein